MRKLAIVMVLAGLMLALVGCGDGPDKCRTDKALLEDNFNDTACGWDQYEEGGASAGYAGSEYFLAVHEANTSAVAVPGADFRNISVDVLARLESGSTNNNLGLLCRYQDSSHFYAFMISSDGYYAIVKVVGGTGYQILSGDGAHLLPSEAIQKGEGAENVIRAVCYEDQLTLSVNGQQLAAVSDSDLESGDVGFIVSTYEEGETEVRFDNLIALDPAALGYGE